MAGVMGVVGVFFVVALVVAGYLVAAHRARGAADLSALSGAGAYQRGADPCAAARRTAGANGGRVTACDRVGDQIGFVVSVTVVVEVRVLLPGLPRTMGARAHAGPVHEGG
jgi:secretion/DNA translocation related TadE-like protein